MLNLKIKNTLLSLSIIFFCIVLIGDSFLNKAFSLDEYEKEIIEEKNIKELLLLKQVSSDNKNSEKYLYISFIIGRHYFEKKEFEKSQNEFESIINQPGGYYYFATCNCYLGKIYQTRNKFSKAYKSYDLCLFAEDNYALMMFSSDDDYFKKDIKKIAKKEHKRLGNKLNEQIVKHYKDAESQLAQKICEDIKSISICED
ncbi:secreted protein, partial [Candidatus Magnetomorum sp. HK-1]